MLRMRIPKCCNINLTKSMYMIKALHIKGVKSVTEINAATV